MGTRRSAALFILMALCQGCIVAPLRVSNDLRVKVTDRSTGSPIAGAAVVYLVCDIHDSRCGRGRLVETVSDGQGQVRIKGDRQWGVWIPAPGGLPVPNHTIAIWAQGYSAYVFQQYDSTLRSLEDRIANPAMRAALDRIPGDQGSSDPALNPPRELGGGQIRLEPIRKPSSK